MGLFSVIGGLIGSGKAKKASKKAEKAQIAALEKGIAEQTRQFDITNADFQPYRDIGGKGLAGLGDLTGVNGDPAQQTAIDALKASPFYQSLFRTGEEAVLQNASATGGLRGGNTERGLADFGADTLMQTIQQQLSNLGGLAGIGMGATESVANFGANKANAVTSLLGKQGDARASGLLFRGGLAQQNWNNIGAFADQAASAFMGAGGLPGGSTFNLGQMLGGGF